MQGLIQVIGIDEKKCVNCHRCISVCPVKFCNDASGDFIKINKDLCIGCGACIEACRHGARYGIDDTESFLRDCQEGVPMVAIVAPGATSSYPDKLGQINGWLRSIGVSLVADVSFGAELTVYSYLNYVDKHQNATLIAQPCPSIVTYIEIYRPELLPNLAPIHSPMGHTATMLKTFFPDFANHRIVAISPCYSKKREFEETGLIDYNVTFKSLNRYFKEKNIDLGAYPSLDYEGPLPERAVGFSSPGGLLETAAREILNISALCRRIEGPSIYSYLSGLHKSITNGIAPLMIDCLNCEMGCNGGPGTDRMDKTWDEVDFPVRERIRLHKMKYSNLGKETGIPAHKAIRHKILEYWRPGLYNRAYRDRSESFTIQRPNEQDLNKVYLSMHKYERKDHYHCAACGYNNCEDMAVAIANGINKKENCHHYYFFMNA